MTDKTLRDINRREITLENNQIKQALPEYFGSDYPKLIQLLEAYFEFLDSDGKNSDNAFGADLKKLHLTRDIGQTPASNLTFIEDELLLGQNYLEGILDARTGAELSNNYYRTKGTKYSIERFFRSFFGTDPVVEYGKDLVFEVSGASTSHVQRFIITTGPTLTETITGAGASRRYNYDITLTVTLGNVEYSVPISITNLTQPRVSLQLTPQETKTYLSQATYVSGGRERWKPRLIGTGGEIHFESQFAGAQENVYAIEGGAIEYSAFTKVIGEDKRGTPIGPNSGKYILNDKIYQYWGLLIKTDIAQSEWIDLYKLFAHPGGMYVGSEVQLVAVNTDIGFDVMPAAPWPADPEPPAFVALAQMTLTTLTEISGIVTPVTSGDSTIRIDLDQYNVEDFVDSTYTSGDSDLFGSVDYLDKYYQTLRDMVQETSPRMDEDSTGGDSSAMKMSNIAERMDQDEFTIYDSST